MGFFNLSKEPRCYKYLKINAKPYLVCVKALKKNQVLSISLKYLDERNRNIKKYGPSFKMFTKISEQISISEI